MRLPALGLVLLALVLCAAPAGAAQDLTGFETAFPKASKLCQRADAGKLGKALKPDAAKVRRACATLRQRYSDAYTAYRTTVAPVSQQIKDVVRGVRETCLAARKNRDARACREAQAQAREKTRELRRQIAAAAAVLLRKNEASRKAFWAAIRKLKGGKGLKQDAPPTQAPADDAPSDSEIDNA